MTTPVGVLLTTTITANRERPLTTNPKEGYPTGPGPLRGLLSKRAEMSSALSMHHGMLVPCWHHAGTARHDFRPRSKFMVCVPEWPEHASGQSDQRQGSMRPNWCSQIGSEWASGQMRHEFRRPGKAFGIHGASDLRPIQSRFDCTSWVA